MDCMRNAAITTNDLITTIADTVCNAVRSIHEPGYLDVIGSAHYLGIRLRTFESIAKNIPCHRLNAGGKRLYSRADLDAFMRTRREIQEDPNESVGVMTR